MVKSKGRRIFAVASIPMIILMLGARVTFPEPFGFRQAISAANSEGQANYAGDYDDPLSRGNVDGENQLQRPQNGDQDAQAPEPDDDSSYLNTPPDFNPFTNYDELPAPSPSDDENTQLDPPQNPSAQLPSLNDDSTGNSPTPGGYVPLEPRGIVVRPGSRSPILPSSPLLMTPPGSAALPNVWPH
ncbi:MAG TPA: hypothetical protein VHY56_14425 [Candidatus Binataceae bacterium]|nr:hypothetical protein [Candidatus Binataceae bacterium]